MRWARRTWAALPRLGPPGVVWANRSWLAMGVAVGIVLTILFTSGIQPLFRESAEWEKGKLVVLSGRDQSDGGQRRALINQWNAEHPEQPAEIIELPAEADGQRSEMVARAREKADNADVFNLDVTWTAEFAQSGYLRPLSSVDTSGFLRRPLESCRYQGVLWALPFNTDAGLLFYRKDLVQDEPLGLDDIADTSTRALRAAQDARLTAGYAGQLLDYEGLTVNALELIWAEKGDVVDESGKVVIDSDRTRRALRWLADGLKGEKPVVLPESRTQNEQLTTQAFRDGKVAFMRNWPVAHRTLQGNRGESAGRPAIDFEVAQLPGPSVLGGQNLAISAKSTKPRAAQALIEFLTGPRSQQLLFERGGLAATRGIVYQDSRVATEHPYARTLLKAIEDARLRPVTPYYSRFSDEFRSIVRYALDHDGALPGNAEESLTAALQGR
ncbi:carbohydrate ABC transporter substrate-binding protein, CUT1 family [Lentzea waywayandensis]|uniref:Carbohydrate ABC transporter substrate-binding protein, CUT1 family n=1 Tax=Lentzea waywayandensis TaxID=84724 RepID=A0A1I6CVK1_9PSEU|nr:extracellular solute-binding protein [Lentzea waywayandensis]SFQ97269.1 carbohydrate ABC transporter substrate-binding protein, CUT1 family [Lentzea waywayandensis]